MKSLAAMRRSSLAGGAAFGPTPLEPGTLVWAAASVHFRLTKSAQVVDKDGGQVWTKAEVLALDGNNVQAAQFRVRERERGENG